MDGTTYGVELGADWRALDEWRLQATYSYLQMQLHVDKDSGDKLSENAEEENPHHQFSLRSSMDLPGNLEFDMGARYVDNLPSSGVESYIGLDARLGWKPTENLDVSIVGQNLIDSHHFEFRSEFIDIQATEIERGIYGKITWRF